MKNKRSAAVCMFLLILDPKTGALYTVLVQPTYSLLRLLYSAFIKIVTLDYFLIFLYIPSFEYYTWRVDICVYSIYIYTYAQPQGILNKLINFSIYMTYATWFLTPPPFSLLLKRTILTPPKTFNFCGTAFHSMIKNMR